MWTTFLMGAAALALTGSVVAFAQQPPASPPAQQSPPRPTPPEPPQASPGQAGQSSAAAESDRKAFLDARIAALRAGLALTSDQDKSWPAFERAYRDYVAMRMEQRRSIAEPGPEGDEVGRLQRWADAAYRRAGALKQLADAAAPLFQSLDEAQKSRFWTLLRPFQSRFAAGDGSRGFGSGDRWRDDDRRDGRRYDDRMPMPGPGWGYRDRDEDGGPMRGGRGYGPPGFGPPGWHRHGDGPRYGWRDGYRRDDERGGYGSPGYGPPGQGMPGPGYGPRMGPGYGPRGDGPGWRDRDEWWRGPRGAPSNLGELEERL